MVKGWTGKRLRIDLNLQRSWSEEIPREDLVLRIGGRGLNSAFFSEEVSSSISPSSPEYPIVFAVGPLTGTFAPCSGWTSISGSSPLVHPPGYFHVSMPGHWGAQLKFAGFDQCVVQGRSEKPIYLSIDGEKVRFEDARSLWGKDTVETTVSIQEAMGDRTTEVLCIGPAGEGLLPFANIVNRFSWTADHVGPGYVLGTKNLKAIAIHGETPVFLEDPKGFLARCSALRDRIHMDRTASRLKESGTFFLLGTNGGGFGIQNFHESRRPDMEETWGTLYTRKYLYGREGCFSCPIHCGRITQVEGNFFGGVHLEGAWSLGPRIGITDWEATLRLYRLCQRQGIDPSAAGSLLSWVMDSYERGILSEQELGRTGCRWGDEEAARKMIDQVILGTGGGEVLRHGSLRAAQNLGKGLDLVAHSAGMDLPIRDPRSSMEYALSLALFPAEWDYLSSMTPIGLSDGSGIAERVAASEELKVLSDLACLCPLVVARLGLISPSDIAEMTSFATGLTEDPQEMISVVRKTLQMERALSERNESGEKKPDLLAVRFFNDPSSTGSRLDRGPWNKAISDAENRIAHGA